MKKRRGRWGVEKKEAEGKGTTFGSQEITRLLGVLGKWGSDQPAPQLLAYTPCNPHTHLRL